MKVFLASKDDFTFGITSITYANWRGQEQQEENTEMQKREQLELELKKSVCLSKF